MGMIAREINSREEWNRLVLGLPHYDLRQGYEWGELQREAGWMPYRYAIVDGGIPTAAVSVVARKLPLIPHSILYAPRGPLLDWKDEMAWSGLMAAIRPLADKVQAILLRISPAIPNDEGGMREALLRHGFIHLPNDWTTWNAPRIIMTLDVNLPLLELRKQLRDRVRQYIGRTTKRGGLIETHTSSEAMARFHGLLTKLGKRKGLPVKAFLFYEAIRREYLVNGQGCLLLASFRETDMAGLLAVRFGRWAYLLYASIDTESEVTRTLHPGPSLYWEFIQWAKEVGCTAIDWGGSGTHFPAREDDSGFGVYRFKDAFGSSLDYLTGYYDLVFRPRLYGVFRLAEQRLLPLAWHLRAKFNK